DALLRPQQQPRRRGLLGGRAALLRLPAGGGVPHRPGAGTGRGRRRRWPRPAQAPLTRRPVAAGGVALALRRQRPRTPSPPKPGPVCRAVSQDGQESLEDRRGPRTHFTSHAVLLLRRCGPPLFLTPLLRGRESSASG